MILFFVSLIFQVVRFLLDHGCNPTVECKFPGMDLHSETKVRVSKCTLTLESSLKQMCGIYGPSPTNPVFFFFSPTFLRSFFFSFFVFFSGIPCRKTLNPLDVLAQYVPTCPAHTRERLTDMLKERNVLKAPPMPSMSMK